MANRAYLLAVTDTNTTWIENATEEIIAEGINEIPVFWASLFSEADRQLDTYEGDEGNIQIPNWCVQSNVAKERLAALAAPISELLDERSKQIWSLWVRHLTAETATYFKTNAAEVWGLDPDGYDAYMKTMLQAFATPSPTTVAAAIEANELTYADGTVSWDDDEETICKLAGADHIRDVPWLEC